MPDLPALAVSVDEWQLPCDRFGRYEMRMGGAQRMVWKHAEKAELSVCLPAHNHGASFVLVILL